MNSLEYLGGLLMVSSGLAVLVISVLWVLGI